jgi:hypothetical protein
MPAASPGVAAVALNVARLVNHWQLIWKLLRENFELVNFGALANKSPAFALAIKASATLPLRWASCPVSSSKVSNMAKDDGPS